MSQPTLPVVGKCYFMRGDRLGPRHGSAFMYAGHDPTIPVIVLGVMCLWKDTFAIRTKTVGEQREEEWVYRPGDLSGFVPVEYDILNE